MEYSRRGMILGLSNPSQDSAFGSMTDGESSRASSFKLSSFASMNSPIDEGVEDLLVEGAASTSAAPQVPESIATTMAGLKYIDSAGSSPCHDHHAHASSSRDISPNHSASSRYLEPPKLIINNHSSSTTNTSLCYTSSPLRKCATTEVFSQKYRVSSFEDMSYSSRVAQKSIKNSSRKIFRSFEEERRIDSAFMPIDTTRSTSVSSRLSQQLKQQRQASPSSPSLQHQLSLPPLLTPTSPKQLMPPAQYNQLTKKKKNASFQNLQSIAGSSRDRVCQWRNKLIKSNECLFETSFNMSPSSTTQSEIDRLLSHGSSTHELPTSTGSAVEVERFILTPEPVVVASNPTPPSSRGTRADRQQQFSLAKFKHSTILDSISLEDFSEPTTTSCSNSTEIEARKLESSSTDDTSDQDSSSVTDSLLKSPLLGGRRSASDVRKYLDEGGTGTGSEAGSGFGSGNEEKTPLLEGMELSPISPTESEQML